MIYVVQIQGGKYIKVGYSKADSSCERIAALQTGSPYQIEELFCVDGTLMQEKALHSALRSAFARVMMPMPPNEWYPGKNHFFKEFLSNLKFGFDMGLSFIEKYNVSVKQPSVKNRVKKKTSNYEPNIRWP